MTKASRAAAAERMGDEDENSAREAAMDQLRDIFDGHELSTLENALMTAREKFTEDAKVFRALEKEIAERGDAEPPAGSAAAMFARGDAGVAGARRLAEQFERQAADTLKLYELIEGR